MEFSSLESSDLYPAYYYTTTYHVGAQNTQNNNSQSGTQPEVHLDESDIPHQVRNDTEFRDSIISSSLMSFQDPSEVLFSQCTTENGQSYQTPTNNKEKEKEKEKEDREPIPSESPLIYTHAIVSISTLAVDPITSSVDKHGQGLAKMVGQLAKTLFGGTLAINLSNQANGNTLLHVAAKLGYTAVVTALLENGAEIDAINSLGQTPLYLAIASWNIDTVRLLLERGANREQVSDLARTNGRPDINVALLLVESDQVDTNNSNEEIPCRIDVSDIVSDEEALLHCVIEHGFGAIVQILLKIGISIDAINSNLHRAIECPGGALALLLDKLTDVNVIHSDGQTYLHYAVLHGDSGAVQLLLNRGADANIPDSEGRTPLHLAAASHQQGNAATVEQLLDHGAEINSLGQCGRTPLSLAVQSGNKLIVEILLEDRANVRAPDQDGQTPLHVAAQNGHVEIVRLLLDHGADANAKGKKGQIPLELSIQRDHMDIVALLTSVESSSPPFFLPRQF